MKYKESRNSQGRFVKIRGKTKYICPRCGKIFYSWHNRKFCSSKCFYSSDEFKLIGKGNIKEKIVKKCIVCGNRMELHPCDKDAKFCSSKCYGRFYKNREMSPETILKIKNTLKKRWDKIGRKKRKRSYHSASTSEYKNWRIKVFERDDYTCQNCRKRGCYLEAHHKKGWTKYPKLRYKIDNGITLCRECHKLER